MIKRYFLVFLCTGLLLIVVAAFYHLYSIPFHIPRKDKSAPNEINGVPLKIYQSWQSHIVPANMKKTVLHVVEENPEFDYYLYSDADSRAFIKENYDDTVVKAFDSLRPGAYKSDLWRYCILYKQGGVYFDIKMVPLIKIKQIIENNNIVFVKDIGNSQKINDCVWNGLMISPPGNKVFKHCIDEIVDNCELKLYKRNNLDITGPCLLGRMIKKHTPTDYFNNNILTLTGTYIEYHNIPYFIREYPGYRREQGLFQKNQHYTTLYDKKQVYQ
jgi:mannosyltransferase OCH1-like enzyme